MSGVTTDRSMQSLGRFTANGGVSRRRMRIAEGAGVTVMPVDKLDVLFAYTLSLITVIALIVIPDTSQKIIYLVFSSILIIIASFFRAWTEREVN
jgi:hypothetical protein